LEIEEVGGKPLNAERGPVPCRPGIEIAAQAALQIEIGRDSAAVEELLLAVIERALAERTLRLDPQLVIIGADPALPVPAELGIAAVPAALELIEDGVSEYSLVHYWLYCARFHA